uniref:Fido domain-containing protein n=1 Tax=Rhabditophanes sp. KR3021 TaxID=114890 RepID=A0AC35TZC0_9BILA
MDKDLVLADSRSINAKTNNTPVVLEYDNRIIKELDVKRENCYKRNIFASHRALTKSYYRHVYHTVALEGNTMSYIQTRTFLETGRAIGGKSIFEHNEILGLDAALRFLNQSKIQLGAITLSDILQIHHKVLAFVDPDNAGKFRDVQVYIGPFTPPGKSINAKTNNTPVVLEYDNRIIKELDVKRENCYKRNIFASHRALTKSYYRHVYHTVALEGNTMSYIQTRTFLETGRAIGGKSIFEHNEILGLDAALRFLNQSKIQLGAITLSDILQIHHKVLAFVDPDNAGKFRDVQVYIGPFTPPGPEFVVDEMKQFIDWLNDETSLEMDCVELAAIAHYKFVFIHPFIDGNGRTGRLLMNLILSRSGFPPIIIPVEERLTYYQALKEANDGDLRPFIRFIVSQTDKTLQKFIDSVSTCTSDAEDCLDGPGQRIEVPEDTDKNRLDANK